MIKEISWTGLSTVPSDYTCPDGELTVCANLTGSDGSLRPAIPPHPSCRLPDNTVAAYIHKSSDCDNIICWQNADTPCAVWSSDNFTRSRILNPYPGHKTPPHIASLGNILMLVFQDRIDRFIWKQDTKSYISLGNTFPDADIRFALDSFPMVSQEEEPMSFQVPEQLESYVNNRFINFTDRSVTIDKNSPEWHQFQTNLQNAVFARLNSYTAKARKEGMFVTPFFVRYALRLFDGSLVRHSAPVLMTPCSSSPIVKYSSASLRSDDLVFRCQTQVPTEKCLLSMKMISAEGFDNWKELITHIDIFISPAIYSIDTEGEIYAARFLDSASDTRTCSVSGSSGIIADPFTSDPETFLSGEGFEFKTKPSVRRQLHGNFNYFRLPAEKSGSMPKSLKETSRFYLVCSIPVEAIASLTSGKGAGFHHLPIIPGALETLETLQLMSDDWCSHNTMSAQSVFIYNSRLHLGNISQSLFSGFPVTRMMNHIDWPAPRSGQKPLIIESVVTLRKDGKTYILRQPPAEGPASYADFENNFPAWIWFPDPDATEIRIRLISQDQQSDERPDGWIIPLRRHEFLYGACWLGSIQGLPPKSTEFIRIPAPSTEITRWLTSSLYVSEAFNPFIFKPESTLTVGSGEILGLASASRPVSQGQFGQTPLYAFTTEGVWALSPGESGSYQANQPILRDVCNNPAAITPLDSSVVFPTSRGLILLSGAQSQTISEPLGSRWSFPISGLPGIRQLIAERLPELSDLTDSRNTTFLQFIKECHIIYNYDQQQLLVFHPGFSHMYVLAMQTAVWSTMLSDLIAPVQAYPKAMAVSRHHDRSIWLSDFSTDLRYDSKPATPALIISRPIKLDNPDILKTVTTVIQRGQFHNGAIASVLYGSRNLSDWHTVWSSTTHIMQGYSGTPWKYFRIALLCRLAPDESIDHATIRFTQRLTRKLR